MTNDTYPPREWPDAPERIYLQVCSEDHCDESFAEHKSGEITWCKDKTNHRDIEYVRADRAERGEVDRGPWRAGVTEGIQRTFIESDDFTRDVRLYVDGDFGSQSERMNYARAIAGRLNVPPSHAGDEALLRQCEWKEHDPNGAMPDSWDSACGETWSFVDGGDPGAHNVRFCQGCGRKVLPVAYGDNHGAA